ncbi:MAG TPA: histidine kinase [Vicinamibacteria bacterium]|nr:histidine kinase [Vicinamibacteria bacterium]
MAQREIGVEPGWRLAGREVALIVAFWAFLAAVSVANRLLDPRGPGLSVVPPSVPIILTLCETGLWAALTPLVFRLASRFHPAPRRWLWQLPLLLLVGLALAVLVHLAVSLVRTELLEGLPRRRPSPGLWPGLLRLWFLNDFIIYLGVLAAGFAREYSRRYQARHQEALRLRAEAAALQAQLAEAQVAALRMQLNPHFLFNTLHAISALVGRDPAGVRRMIARLSELLRATLDESSPAERRVEEEVDFIGRYLEIMQVRFEGRLAVETSVEPGAREALVPTLILQPLVENAVKHGVGRRRGGRIAVAARRRGDRLQLSVHDSGPGPPPDGASASVGGIGLRNTAARLRQMYGDDQRLSVRTAEEGGALALVELPYRVAAPGDLRAAPAGHER